VLWKELKVKEEEEEEEACALVFTYIISRFGP